MSDREYFDQYVEQQGDFNPFADRGWRTLRARFQGLVGGGEWTRMLDVGCGTGHSSRIYSPEARQYVGLDLSLGSLEIASQAYPGLEFAQGDACGLPFESGSFDLVAFSSVLHHIADRREALREALRVLRPGGAVFAFDPNLLHPAMALFRHPASPLYTSEGVSPTEKPLLPSEVRQDFEAAGFASVRQRCQADIPYRSVAPKLLNAFLTLYNFGDRVLHLGGLGRWIGSFVLTAAKKPC